jgi:hypothetical protein
MYVVERLILYENSLLRDVYFNRKKYVLKIESNICWDIYLKFIFIFFNMGQLSL